MRWLALVFWFALCFGVAGVGGRWTAGEIGGWYRTLARPAIAPPNWVFGPVWTLLYGLMAFAAWRVWLAPPSPARSWALGLFLGATGAESGLDVDLFSPDMPLEGRWLRLRFYG